MDQRLVELSVTLEDAFTFVDNAKDLRSNTRILEKNIIQLLKTTSECCKYLQEYLKDGFIGMLRSPLENRPLKSVIGRMLTAGAGEGIERFIQSIRDQKNDLSSDIALHNALVANRTSGKIDIMCK